MSPTHMPETILVHPALAGCTLLIRHGSSWAAFDIHPEGHVSHGRPVDTDPAAAAWRGGLSL